MKKATTLVLVFLFVTVSVFAEKLSTQELIDNLKSADAGKREKAARELGERGEKLGLDALVAATTDREQKVQMAVVKAIGNISDPRHVSALSTAVRNTEGKAQKEAMHLLIEHYVPSGDKNALAELFDSIGKLFNPPHPVAVEPWIEVDAEAVDAVLFALDDQSSENRIEAAATLGILRAEQAIPRLAYYLKSPNKKMVRTCIRSIGYIGKTDAGADLVPLLKNDDTDIVLDSARVLGQFRYKDAIPELRHLLEYSKKTEHKQVALQALSRIGEPSEEPIMKQYFSDKDRLLRQYAIEGLGRMRLKNYTETLERESLREKEDSLKLALAFSLYALGRRAHLDPLVLALDDKSRRAQAREYLIELGAEAVPDVSAYLKPAKGDLKISIIQTLGDMHQPAAIPYLEPYLNDKDVKVAQAATDAIRELKKVQSIS